MTSGIINGLVMVLKAFLGIFLKLLLCVAAVMFIAIGIFSLISFAWKIYFVKIKKEFTQVYGEPTQPKKRSLLKQLFVDTPRQYTLDKLTQEEGYFYPKGIHLFAGEQGCGKTIAAVEFILRLQKMYPNAKTITNFGLETEDTQLTDWQQLLDYGNGHKGVIVGLDEIQNWFQSGNNKLPTGMLEIVSQNRKNNRIIIATSQVVTRLHKGIREQATYIYQPHTFLGCFTIVFKKKPIFDYEGQILELKRKGIYCFVHTKELREAYDTYKVIHTLSKDLKQHGIRNLDEA